MAFSETLKIKFRNKPERQRLGMKNLVNSFLEVLQKDKNMNIRKETLQLFGLSSKMHCRFQVFLRGVLGVVRKSRGGTIFLCIIAFLYPHFVKSFEGLHKMTPPPPHPTM